MFSTLAEDYRAVRRNDPAIPKGAAGAAEILLCTPGFLAVAAHRGLHFLHSRCGIPVIPRFLSLIVRWWTGIEIHPGAVLGAGVFIDHGSGVVIGESAEVGSGSVIYQGVTLGATGNEKTWKRHPTVGANVVIGSGAKILGPVVIGDDSKVGAGAIVLDSVPEDSTVVGRKASVVRSNGERKEARDTVSLEQVLFRMQRLEARVRLLGGRMDAQDEDVPGEECDYAI
ncbi:MAG: serine O-acetyltransferase EpsC [Aminobacteriaceae bacterium]